MNLNTAASIGLGLIRHREDIGAALGSIAGLGKGVGSVLAGQGFAKIAERFNLPQGLGKQIDNVLEEAKNPHASNSLQALSYLNYFDADQNGAVSREELASGLQRLEASGLHGTGQTGRAYAMGNQLLKHYDAVARLDNQDGGISYADMGRLIRRDGNPAHLSPGDYQTLNT